MTYPYGQQPEQPGGGYPQQAPGQGYPQSPPYGQPQQGYPQSPAYGTPAPGYPQAPQPAYGAMPPAPPEYSAGPTGRPGTATAAAVLAYVQAGITLVPAVIMLSGLFSAGGDGLAFGWAVTIAAIVGSGLLIGGGVQIMGGKSRALIVSGAALEIAICLAWIIFFASLDTGGFGPADYGKGMVIGFAVFFAIMPVISLVLALGGSVTQYLESRRGH